MKQQAPAGNRCRIAFSFSPPCVDRTYPDQGFEGDSTPSNLPESLERQLQSELHHAAASRPNEWIAGRDVGCGAPTAERAGGSHVIGPTRSAPISIRCTVRIGNDGVIEQIKELDPELGVVSLLEREVLEYGEIHVLEG